MTQYLIAIHHPDNYDPSVEDEAMASDIDVLNDEMKAAGVRVFVGGLRAASSATSIRAKPDGKFLITDGPYLETKEHVGGFWVLEAADLDERWHGDARPPSPVGRRSRCGPQCSNTSLYRVATAASPGALLNRHPMPQA